MALPSSGQSDELFEGWKQLLASQTRYYQRTTKPRFVARGEIRHAMYTLTKSMDTTRRDRGVDRRPDLSLSGTRRPLIT